MPLQDLEGQTRDFPINWEGPGAPIPGAPEQGTVYQNSQIHKYDIIGFAFLTIVDVVSVMDADGGLGNCHTKNNSPMSWTTPNQTLDLDTISDQNTPGRGVPAAPGRDHQRGDHEGQEQRSAVLHPRRPLHVRRADPRDHVDRTGPEGHQRAVRLDDRPEQRSLRAPPEQQQRDVRRSPSGRARRSTRTSRRGRTRTRSSASATSPTGPVWTNSETRAPRPAPVGDMHTHPDREGDRVADPLTIVFMPESAYGPTNNCIGIGKILEQRGHRVVFAAEASWAGRLEPLGFEEDLVDLAPPAEGEQDAGQFWTDFITETAPEFHKPTIEQLDTFIRPVWASLIDGAKYCEPQLRTSSARASPT